MLLENEMCKVCDVVLNPNTSDAIKKEFALE